MPFPPSRIAGFLCLLVAVFLCGCSRTPRIDSRIGQNPHLRATSLEDETTPTPAISPVLELEEVKREIRRHCHFKHDLDPTMDYPEKFSLNDEKQDAYRERCYQLKVRGRDLQASIDLMLELYEEAEEPPARVRIGDGPAVIKQELVTPQNAISTLTVLLLWFLVMLFRRGKQWTLPFTDDKNDPFAIALNGSQTPPRFAGLWTYRVLRTASRLFSFVAMLCFPWSLVIVPILLLIDGRWGWAIAAAAGFYVGPFVLTFLAKLFDRSAVNALLRSTGASEEDFEDEYQYRALAWNDLLADRGRERSGS